MVKTFVKQLRKGKVKKLGQKGEKATMKREWESGIFKKPYEGKLWLTETGLVGDEVADKRAHGGPEKALFAYPEKHYEYWRSELNINIEAGGFGENLVIEIADEYSICIGDIYQLGDAVVDVSQPRQPCWKPARRFQVMDLALQIQQTGYTGWYYRVVEEGYVEAGALELLERPHPEWSIQACNEVMHVHKDDLRRANDLAACPALAINWKKRLQKRLRGQESSIHTRVFGPNKE